MTWGDAPDVVATIPSMMLGSRETFVSYTMPLGLHHLIGGDHYAPMPENDDPRRADWSAIYYHRADAPASASTARARQRRRRPVPPAAARALERSRARRRTCCSGSTACPGTDRLKSGRTLWDELVRRVHAGAEQARQLETRWTSLRGRSTPRATRPCWPS